MKRWKQRPAGSNWGDFGDDDQIGRMNLVTPERRRVALEEAREGIAFCLSLPLDYPGGSVLVPDRKPPRLFAVERASGGRTYNFNISRINTEHTDVYNDDCVLLYTQYSTQWDALGHVGHEFDADADGTEELVYYNGFRAGPDLAGPGETGEAYANSLGIERLAETCVQGRGVLVNLHAIFANQRVRVGYDALLQALDAQGAEIETGDFLCVYTGFGDLLLGMNKQPDGENLRQACATLDGNDPRLLNWITDSGLVAICSDNLAVEEIPAGTSCGHRHAKLPLHEHCLFKLGINLGELWNFGQLANALAQRGRSKFLLTAPPLRLPGSVGSPVTPIGTI